MDLTFSAVSLTCCHKGCGIVFAVPAWWEIRRREDHTKFYCPNGHCQGFGGETEAEKLSRQLSTVRSDRDKMVDDNRRLERSLKRAKSALKKATASK